jgi:hypothetical protein
MRTHRFFAIVFLMGGALFATANSPVRALAQTKTGPIPWHGPLTIDGLGRVRLGISIADAEKAARRELRPKTEFEDDSCWMTDFLYDPGGPVFMISDDKIVRIEIWEGTIRADRGITVGSSEQAVRDAYRDRVVSTPHPYDPEGFYLRILGADGRAAMIFETSNGKIVGFRTGLIPMVDFIEHCL